MVKKVFLIFSLFLSASAGYASDPLRSLAKRLKDGLKKEPALSLAVLNFPYSRGRLSTGSYLVSERLVTYMAQESLTVIERRLLEKLMEEKKFLETGMVSPRALKTMGQIHGVDAIVVGTLADLSDISSEVTARVVRVNTAEVLAAASVVIPRIWVGLPCLPKFAQARVAVPVSPASLGMLSEESAPEQTARKTMSRKNRRPRLGDADDKKQPYRPAPVPFFMPSVKQLNGAMSK